MAKTNSERQQAYRQRMRAAGFRQVMLWADDETARLLGRMKPEQLAAMVREYTAEPSDLFPGFDAMIQEFDYRLRCFDRHYFSTYLEELGLQAGASNEEIWRAYQRRLDIYPGVDEASQHQRLAAEQAWTALGSPRANNRDECPETDEDT
jgi:hypothetical protein